MTAKQRWLVSFCLQLLLQMCTIQDRRTRWRFTQSINADAAPNSSMEYRGRAKNVRFSRNLYLEPFGSDAPPTDPPEKWTHQAKQVEAGVKDESMLPCQGCACHDPHKWLRRPRSTLMNPCPQQSSQSLNRSTVFSGHRCALPFPGYG